jgi:hypothetical protein
LIHYLHFSGLPLSSVPDACLELQGSSLLPVGLLLFEFTETERCLLESGVDVFKGLSFFELIEIGVESLEPSNIIQEMKDKHQH